MQVTKYIIELKKKLIEYNVFIYNKTLFGGLDFRINKKNSLSFHIMHSIIISKKNGKGSKP